MKRTVLTVALLILTSSLVLSEAWLPFSHLIKDSDFIAQYQELVRQEGVIGSRLVRVYWEKDGFKRPKYLRFWKPWTLEQFSKKTDVLVTKFVFCGSRGQHLWTVAPENGVIQFPGVTAEHGVGAEISCSATEFHDILVEVGRLKRQGKDVKGNLTVAVFGKEQKSK